MNIQDYFLFCVQTVMFCSNECLDEGSRQIRKCNELNLSCESFPFDYRLNVMKALDFSNGLKDLEDIYTDQTSTTVFDCDFSNTSDPKMRRDMLKCAASLRKREQDDSDLIRSIKMASMMISEVSSSVTISTILSNFIKCQGAINECNNIVVQFKEEFQGAALFLFGSLLNHSCDPSVEMFYIDSSIVTFVNRPIKSGQQLFLNYK